MNRAWLQAEWRKTVARLADGAAEVKAEYADKILELLEAGGNDVVVLEEVEAQLPLMVQAGVFELQDVAKERLLEAARWMLMALGGHLQP